MKQIKTLLIAAILFLGATQISNAQTKVAHVDIQEIMSKYPAMIEAQKQLEKLSGTYDTDFKKMLEEFQTKRKKYTDDFQTKAVTDAVSEERSKEIQDMERRLSDFRDNAQKELQQKQAEIFNPIMEKVKTSIQKVGKAKGFQYVLDSSNLLLADGTNISADVKKDLGF